MGNMQGKSLSSCLPLQSITLQTVLLWEIGTQIFLAKAIQLCPPVNSLLYCRKGEKKGLPLHCLLRSSWHRLRESRAGIQLILPLSKEKCAVTTLSFLTLCDFSGLLTNWKSWPPNWTEVLNVINSGNTSRKDSCFIITSQQFLLRGKKRPTRSIFEAGCSAVLPQ